MLGVREELQVDKNTPDYIKKYREKVGKSIIHVAAVVTIIFDNLKKSILFVQRKDNDVWVLPGGIIEPYESPSQAIIRETEEETSLKITPIRVIGVFGGPMFCGRYRNGDQESSTVIGFESKIISGNIKADLDEIKNVKYIPFKQIDLIIKGEQIKKIVEIVLRNETDTFFD